MSPSPSPAGAVVSRVEDFTPYADSVMWRVHHAYFAQRGTAVWTERDIPSQGTSNAAQAREHVRLLRALASDLGPEAPLGVLEVGSGSGDFAANFMDVLQADAPELLPRVRLHLTDYLARTVAETATRPRVAPWIASGHIVTSVFDVTNPTALAGPFVLVIANYVCCAIPMRPLQKWGDEWREPFVETSVDLDGHTLEGLLADATRPDLMTSLETRYDWRVTALDEYLGEPFHVAVVRDVTDALFAASLFYPRIYLDFVRRVPLAPGGVMVTNDYGYLTVERLRGLQERRPESFANCLGQEVQFVIFDAFARVAGWSVHRNSDPLDEINRAVVGPGPFGPALSAALDYRPLWGRPDWAHLLDFQQAAKELDRVGDRERALRFWLRCAELDPSYADFRYAIGDNAIEVGLPELASEHLLVGLALAPDAHDWEFMLGRAAVGSDDISGARDWYKRALAREPDATTYVNLAALALADEDFGGAYRACERALALDPEHPRAASLLDEVRERVWDEAVVHFRGELPVVAHDEEE